MELDALDRMLAMTHRHDEAVLGPGRDLERCRKTVAGDDEGVISGGGERIRQAAEDATAGVVHRDDLAVHHLGSPYDGPAVREPDHLVPQAHADGRPAQ